MVALALPFAYLHARAGSVSLKVFGGIMLGISFVLLNNLAGHMGLLRGWTPWMAAAMPSLIYLLPVDGRLRLAGALPLNLMDAPMTQGLILFAHGARDPRWAEPFEAVAARVAAQRPGVAVRLAFLELMTPDLPQAGAELVAAGCTASRWCPCSWARAATCARTCRVCWTTCAGPSRPAGHAASTAVGELGPVAEAWPPAAALATLAPA
jgi:hypothetical protein